MLGQRIDKFFGICLSSVTGGGIQHDVTIRRFTEIPRSIMSITNVVFTFFHGLLNIVSALPVKKHRYIQTYLEVWMVYLPCHGEHVLITRGQNGSVIL